MIDFSPSQLLFTLSQICVIVVYGAALVVNHRQLKNGARTLHGPMLAFMMIVGVALALATYVLLRHFLTTQPAVNKYRHIGSIVVTVVICVGAVLYPLLAIARADINGKRAAMPSEGMMGTRHVSEVSEWTGVLKGVVLFLALVVSLYFAWQ